MADSVAVMRSPICQFCGVIAKFNPLARTSCSDWVSSLSDRFFTHLSYVSSSVEFSFFCLKVRSSAFLVLLACDCRFRNFRVCLSLLLACLDSCAFSIKSVTFSKTALGRCDFNFWSKLSASLFKASVVKWTCLTLSFSSRFYSLARLIPALWPFTVETRRMSLCFRHLRLNRGWFL